jgi:DNA-binding response OmpR family regulator
VTRCQLNKYEILIVEDDPYISELVTVTLSSTWYAITCVTTGIEAMAKLSEYKPDIVLLDILIPEPDGWVIYKYIRNNPELSKTRVIIVTALPITREALRGKHMLPTDAFMTKPFELDELRMKVNTMLSSTTMKPA